MKVHLCVKLFRKEVKNQQFSSREYPAEKRPDNLGRVEPGSCLPGASTDPDAPNFRTAGPRHSVSLE
jgi:hypothetical protein